MTKMVDLQEYYTHSQKCKMLLQIPEIRFAAFLDGMGSLVAGKLKEDLLPFTDEDERRKMFMEVVLRVTTRKEFDHKLEPVQFAAARRKKVVTMTFRVGNEVLFVSAEPHIDIDQTAEKIIKMFDL